MLRSLAWSLLGLLALSLPAPVQAQSVDVIPPPNPPRLVVDRADMLSSSEERLLEAKLNAYNDTTSTQIVVVTLPDLGGADAGQYATELGEAWGVGQGGKDNGVVILVSRDDRQIFIATGYGLEGAIPDVIASRIYRNIMVPNFREGRVYAGFSEATDALIAAARGEYEAEAPRRGDRGDGGIDLATLFIFLIILFFVISAMRKGGRGGGKGKGRGNGRRYRRGRGMPPVIIWGGGGGFGGGSSGGGGFGGFGGGGGGGGFGGFGGGGFGGGGAGGGW